MPDFSKTIIYKIVHKDDLNDENIYIGHTTNFKSRNGKHKDSCNNPNSKQYNQKKYKYIRENGGWENWIMIEIEKYPCNSVHEARARERQIQTKMKAKLNTDIAGRTPNEWWEDNKERLQILNKEWRTNNKDYLNEKMRNYRKNNPEKMREYDKKRYEKKRYEDNKKIPCEICGFIGAKKSLKRHQKSKKCIEAKKIIL